MPFATRWTGASLLRRWWALIFVLLGCSGCAGLPKDIDRPISSAFDAASEPTLLSKLVAERRAAARGAYPSGFMLLSGPQEAYGSRLALVQAAQKTLDLQYYAIHADASTARLLREVVHAARRGVRVRILLDDFHSTGRNAQVMRLAFVPGIEMRMFNPVAGPRASAFGRLWGSLTDLSRVQQRMHNKLFLADSVMGVTGGRNLGDAYFGQGQAENFVDMDVLAVGPIVGEMARSFDSYWNNPRAYPVQSLITQEELEQYRTQTPPSDSKTAASNDKPARNPDHRAWNEEPMDLRSALFAWGPAVMLVDKPAKIALDGDDAPIPTEGAAPADTVVDGLLQLIDRTRKDLLIISPYFVPGEDIKKAFADARGRGVRVRVLTNSLASNDAPIAHVGYARHREDLLAMGVELYELRSEQAGLGSAFGSSGSGVGESRSMLHSKVVVIDGRLVVVGSMNLDLRSQLQNTEIALLIRSRALATEAAEQIETAMRQGSWRVERADNGNLVWRAPEGSGLQDAHTDPDASLGLRLMLKLLGPLAPDHLL